METLKSWIESWESPLLMASMGKYSVSEYTEVSRPGSSGDYDYVDVPERRAFLDSIVAVYADAEGENDGPNWLAVVEFSDGLFGYVSAGCDYTGWDCQAGGNIVYASSLEEVKNDLVLDDEGRERLVWRDTPLRA